MANGTGKTTTMELIKGSNGRFGSWLECRKKSRHLHQLHHILMWACWGIAVKIWMNICQYKYFLYMNYKTGTANIKTTTTTLGGMEDGRHLPMLLKAFFYPEFVRRFVFDGGWS